MALRAGSEPFAHRASTMPGTSGHTATAGASWMMAAMGGASVFKSGLLRTELRMGTKPALAHPIEFFDSQLIQHAAAAAFWGLSVVRARLCEPPHTAY